MEALVLLRFCLLCDSQKTERSPLPPPCEKVLRLLGTLEELLLLLSSGVLFCLDNPRTLATTVCLMAHTTSYSRDSDSEGTFENGKTN